MVCPTQGLKPRPAVPQRPLGRGRAEPSRARSTPTHRPCSRTSRRTEGPSRAGTTPRRPAQGNGRGAEAARGRRIGWVDSHVTRTGHFWWRRLTQGKFCQVRLSETVSNRAILKQCRGTGPTSTIGFRRPRPRGECRDGCVGWKSNKSDWVPLSSPLPAREWCVIRGGELDATFVRVHQSEARGL